jgi:acyl-CoA thioesterase-1
MKKSLVLVAAIIAAFAAGINPAAAKTITVMAYGDSLIEGHGLPAEQGFPARLEKKMREEGIDVRVINAGVSGETSSGALTRLDWTLAQNPDYVILETGANDMLRGVDPAVTRENIEKILSALKARNIPVLLAGMKALPSYGDLFGGRYDGIYKDLAEKYAKIYYPFFLKGVALEAQYNQDDGMHPNAVGVDVIVGNIFPYVEDLLKED